MHNSILIKFRSGNILKLGPDTLGITENWNVFDCIQAINRAKRQGESACAWGVGGSSLDPKFFISTQDIDFVISEQWSPGENEATAIGMTALESVLPLHHVQDRA